jgi:hypothetical protein
MANVQRDNDGKPIQTIVAWIVAVISFGYMLPWAIAATRGKSNAMSIGLLNFLLGWTVIGWIVALVMACGSHQVVPQTVVMQAPAATPPGWYPGPDGQQRYWNGVAWTDDAPPAVQA